MTLKYPYLLLLLLIYIPLLWWWCFGGRNKSHYASMGLSSLYAFQKKGRSLKLVIHTLSKILQLCAIGFLIVALARPQKNDVLTNSQILGTDIVLALDISESMNNIDIEPNRFQAAKSTAMDFIAHRANDNMGLVIFAGEALSIMPLTNDLLSLQNAVAGIKMGSLGNGTAIGDGLVSAINRVLHGKAASKSIILLTDGTNNTGDVSPSTAADIAALKGIKVYTIGVGRDGSSVYVDPYGLSRTTISTAIDEEALKEIAAKTGGEYFRVIDKETLKNVFEEIDNLEKTKMDVESVQRTQEAFMPWLLAALCCYVLVILFRYTVLIKIP